MSAAIPTSEPAFLRAGETLQFTKTLTDYPADEGWGINYSFRGNAATKIDFSSTASGKDHAVLVSFNDTAQWMPGIYMGVGMVTDGATAKQIWSGQLEILKNIASLEGGIDTRSANRIALDNVRTVISGRASATVKKSMVEGTELERYTHDELMRLEAYLSNKVRNEEIEALQAAGKPTGRTIYAQFTRPK